MTSQRRHNQRWEKEQVRTRIESQINEMRWEILKALLKMEPPKMGERRKRQEQKEGEQAEHSAPHSGTSWTEKGF